MVQNKGGEMVSKKCAEDLPAWIDQQWFCQIFIATYMAFIGQLMDPWDIPAKQALEMM